jgi:hypothetical protein
LITCPLGSVREVSRFIPSQPKVAVAPFAPTVWVKLSAASNDGDVVMPFAEIADGTAKFLLASGVTDTECPYPSHACFTVPPVV